jgi:hypothetical protein
MALDPSTNSELITIDVTCTPRNRANLRRLKTSSIQSYQRWEKENELLYAMIEDESAWLTRLFPDTFISPELFFYALEDGTILCLLGNYIQEMAESYGARTVRKIPGKKFTFHKSKKGIRESKLFHSRENVDKFLTWCRWHGIPEAILFESNDAVLVDECRTGGREIVICLMEIARRSSQYEIEEVPQLIRLEREIEEEELSDHRTSAEEQQGLALDTSAVNTESRGDRSPIDSDSGVESVFDEAGDPASPRLSEFMADEATPEPTRFVPKRKNTNKFEGDKKPQRGSQKESTSLLENSHPKTELDKKVRNHYCLTNIIDAFIPIRASIYTFIQTFIIPPIL